MFRVIAVAGFLPNTRASTFVFLMKRSACFGNSLLQFSVKISADLLKSLSKATELRDTLIYFKYGLFQRLVFCSMVGPPDHWVTWLRPHWVGLIFFYFFVNQSSASNLVIFFILLREKCGSSSDKLPSQLFVLLSIVRVLCNFLSKKD